MDPQEAQEALDLLAKSNAAGKTSRLDFLKGSKGIWEGKNPIPKEKEEYKPPEGFEDCELYNIDIMCWYGTSPYQFKIEALLNNAEAYETRKTLDTKMYELGRGTSSSFSITLRGKDGRAVSRAFTGVVYMEHDIPPFKEVAEDENVEMM